MKVRQIKRRGAQLRKTGRVFFVPLFMRSAHGGMFYKQSFSYGRK